jgi:ribonuclease P protein component
MGDQLVVQARQPKRGGFVAAPASRSTDEANFSTKQSEAIQEARVPSPDVHPRRTRHSEGSSGQGSSPAVGLIWSVQDRAGFARISAEAQKVRVGPIWVRWVADSELMPPRVAFSIGVAVGPAVVRNRLRRRIRAVLRESELPGGLYLFGATPAAAELSSADVRGIIDKMVVRGWGSR